MALATFRCPGCAATESALRSATVQHRCPGRRNQMTTYIRDDQEND